jgi:hypothetical protein
MTIKQQGGVFGRNPTFNDVTIEGTLTFDGDVDINSDLQVDGELIVNRTAAGFGTAIAIKNKGASAGELAIDAGYLTIGKGDVGILFQDGGNAIQPRDVVGLTNSNGLIDLGLDGARFKNLFLAENVVVGSGYGIDFSATAGAGTSELLDDYEEGVWTPNLLNGTSITYTTTPTGNYTKIGNMVYVTASIDVSNSDTADASALTIGGLPFNAINDTMTFTLGRYRSFLAPKDSVVLGAAANSSFIQLFESNNNFILYSEIGSSGILYFSGSYLT